MSFDPIGALFSIGESVIERVWPDPKMQADQKLKLAELAQNGDLAELDAYVKGLMGQLEINKQEAKHKSIFVAGWRPFVGWVCGVGLGWNFVIQPLFNWVAFSFGFDISNAPELDITELLTLLAGMLGLGTIRMREKQQGVASDSLRSN